MGVAGQVPRVNDSSDNDSQSLVAKRYGTAYEVDVPYIEDTKAERALADRKGNLRSCVKGEIDVKDELK